MLTPNILRSATGLGLAALLLTAIPACVSAQKVASIPARPVTVVAAVAPQATTPKPIQSSPVADQEEDDAVMETLARLAPVAAKPTNDPGQEPARRVHPLTVADQSGTEPPPQLIGPLLDPIFEPRDLVTAQDEDEDLVEKELGEPPLAEALEPLNTEDIPLPGPNERGSLERALADTGQIGDLSEVSDPDISYDLPVVLNEQVKFFIDQYQTSHRKIFGHWLARSSRYLPLIQEELAKAGLPQDLCYLPMIESGFRVNAYSPAKAVGAWQFIQSTAKLYGLTVNKDIDERCDPIKSTRAAIRYLSDLHDDLQSWPLAISAYNAGGGRLRTAVEKTGNTDFWELARSRYIPTETKYYLPKLLAAIIVAKNPSRYGFDEVDYEPPLTYETVQVPKSTHLAAVALAAGTDMEEIYSLNRQLRRAVTPADPKFCQLCVPVGTSELINRNLPLVRTTVTTKFKTHVVKKKETMAKISARYGVSKATLLKLNRLREARVKPGLLLQIPYQVKSYKLIAAPPEPRLAAATKPAEETADGELIRHTVRAGESIFQLARRYNVSMENIAAWNNLRDPRRLSVGQTLDIYRHDRNA